MKKIILYFYSIVGDTVHKIKLQDVNELAEFSLTINPLPHIDDIFGREAALAVYFKSNPNSKYENIYNALMESFEGTLFLNTAIQIASLRREILLGEANEKTSEVLQECAKEYRKWLKYSQTMVDTTKSYVKTY